MTTYREGDRVAYRTATGETLTGTFKSCLGFACWVKWDRKGPSLPSGFPLGHVHIYSLRRL